MVNDIYEQMWQQFTDAVSSNSYQCDPYLNGQPDTRRGITALAYLADNSPDVAARIGQFLDHLSQHEPQQYYYPSDELHVTLLSVISCLQGFQLSDIDPQAYVDVFHRALRGLDPIQLELRGVTASPSCIVIQGYPVGNELDILRQRLRDGLQASGLQTSIDARYKLITAHLTAMRFRQPLQNPQQLQALCAEYRHYPFGSVILNQCDLVFNNWYQTLAETHHLARYCLGGQPSYSRADYYSRQDD